MPWSPCHGPHVWATSNRWQQACSERSTNRTHDITAHAVRELRLLCDLFISLPMCRKKSRFAANTSLTCLRCLLMSSQQKETSGSEPLAGHRIWLEFYNMVEFALFSSLGHLLCRASAADFPFGCGVRLWPRTRCVIHLLVNI